MPIETIKFCDPDLPDYLEIVEVVYDDTGRTSEECWQKHNAAFHRLRQARVAAGLPEWFSHGLSEDEHHRGFGRRHAHTHGIDEAIKLVREEGEDIDNPTPAQTIRWECEGALAYGLEFGLLTEDEWFQRMLALD